ncbi:aminotransferase class I/II-fold pyridoxal phosphate-dependent enzyme, partial [Patulibacter sp. S7RM1-6]
MATPTTPTAPRPFAEGLVHALRRERASFATPGHKRSGLVADLPALAHDLPLLCGVEDQRLSGDLLGRAERRAARAWGAAHTRFSVQGSTHANLALALAATRPGEPVLVARTSHKSVLAGLVLSGARPVWLMPEIDPATGAALGVTPDALARALAEHPRATAAWITDPTYVGVRSDLAALAGVAHGRGVPLLVDQAWGAHFGFHPDLPPSALALGADAAVTSVHKTLTAFSQGALLHLSGSGRLAPERVSAAFDALHTTSPSGVILGSLDAARALMEERGAELLGGALERVERLREGAAALAGVRCLNAELRRAGHLADPLRVVLDVTGTGVTGTAIEVELRSRGVQLLMADATHLIPLVTVGDTDDDVDLLLDELRAAIAAARGAVAGRPVVARPAP